MDKLTGSESARFSRGLGLARRSVVGKNGLLYTGGYPQEDCYRHLEMRLAGHSELARRGWRATASSSTGNEHKQESAGNWGSSETSVSGADEGWAWLVTVTNGSELATEG